jgi:dienelactone hydrolase
METAYLIPGYKENIHQGGYRKIRELFEQKHLRVVPVHIHWEFRTFSSYVSQLKSQIRVDGSRIVLFGFSFGAVIAFLAAPAIDPQRLYLCSLSPYFKEDLVATRYQTIRSLGKRRAREMRQISMAERAREITASTVLIAGSMEDPEVINRTQEAAASIPRSKLFMADGASHSMNDCCYLDALQQII